MKKSQILAALALAFALGIAVIPSASTYAKVIYPVGTSQEDINTKNNAINVDVTAANNAYGELEKVTEYSNLYSSIENDNNGLRKLVGDTEKSLKDAYNNDAHTSKTGLNAKIAEVVSYEHSSTNGLYEKNASGNFVYIKSTSTQSQATLKDMPSLSRVSSYADAYKAMKNLHDLAVQNKSILTTNYNTPVAGDPVDTVINDLDDIINGTKAFLDAVKTAFTSTPFAASTVTDFTGLIKAVSDDAFDALVDSSAWVAAADDSYTTEAARYGLIMAAAAKLPKYNYVEALMDAKTEFDKITSNSQEVDYSEAVKYIAAFNTAIKNYRDGKAVNGGTGEGTNKPSDDNKAPNTGILSDAEGSASTTVAMVAGIATALTAAGAGVVAYRNARRSTRK